MQPRIVYHRTLGYETVRPRRRLIDRSEYVVKTHQQLAHAPPWCRELPPTTVLLAYGEVILTAEAVVHAVGKKQYLLVAVLIIRVVTAVIIMETSAVHILVKGIIEHICQWRHFGQRAQCGYIVGFVRIRCV